MHVTVQQLRTQTKKILTAVSHGEKVIVTCHGTEKAQIIPFASKNEERVDYDNVFGMWKDNEKIVDVNKFIRQQRQGLSHTWN